MDNSLLSSAGLNLERIASQVGTGAVRSFLNAKWPSEFEYYMCSLELVDGSGNIVENLIFPVMPNHMQETTSGFVNIKKTVNSVVSIKNTSYPINTINISGTFGRKLRLMLTPNKMSDASAAFNFSKSFGTNKDKELNGYIKTGYGVTKYLERIIRMSHGTDGYLLFFYNLASGNNYLVECTDMSFTQALENNMMWNYNITLKSLAMAEDVIPGGKDRYKKSIKNLLMFSNINKTIDSVVGEISNLTKNVTNSKTKIEIKKKT